MPACHASLLNIGPHLDHVRVVLELLGDARNRLEVVVVLVDGYRVEREERKFRRHERIRRVVWRRGEEVGEHTEVCEPREDLGVSVRLFLPIGLQLTSHTGSSLPSSSPSASRTSSAPPSTAVSNNASNEAPGNGWTRIKPFRSNRKLTAETRPLAGVSFPSPGHPPVLVQDLLDPRYRARRAIRDTLAAVSVGLRVDHPNPHHERAASAGPHGLIHDRLARPIDRFACLHPPSASPLPIPFPHTYPLERQLNISLGHAPVLGLVQREREARVLARVMRVGRPQRHVHGLGVSLSSSTR